MRPRVVVLNGDARVHLPELRPRSVHVVVTSPPYYGCRDYAVCPRCSIRVRAAGDVLAGDLQPAGASASLSVRLRRPDPRCPACRGSGRDDSLVLVWDDPGGCRHRWGPELVKPAASQGAFCLSCGAWRGQLGLEPSPDLYARHLVAIFHEVHRVLRDDGTVWLVLGDSFWGDSPPRASSADRYSRTWNPADTASRGGLRRSAARLGDLKPKDVIGIPWLVAFALRADGWHLRTEIVWSKPDGQPDSVQDRPTRSHEYIFLLTKAERYFYDIDAIREPHKPDPHNADPNANPERQRKRSPKSATFVQAGGGRHRIGSFRGWAVGGRNRRTVWTISTARYRGWHHATFPAELAALCLRAGSSDGGCCSRCGAPWRRIVRTVRGTDGRARPGPRERGYRGVLTSISKPPSGTVLNVHTIGFVPTCGHRGDPVPSAVLDPFAGSGTVGVVARDLGRSAVLIELKSEYVRQIRHRVLEARDLTINRGVPPAASGHPILAV